MPPSSRRWVPAAEGYEIGDLLGAGGMGRVFRARDVRLGREVALKFIRDHDPALVARFVREAQAQARVEHENVCKVYEAGEIDGEPYIAMQLIHGPSLKAIKQELTTPQKVQVMIKVAEGLHAAHRLGLIHRDIKPANVMIERTEDGALHPYVMDFGLARDVGGEEHTHTQAGIGTPAYMPPEQAMGQANKLDRRTDVYSMGATLHDLLIGKPPYEGTTPLDILVQVIADEVPPLRVSDPTIPEDLETIVMKCLEKEPHRRYDSARALAEDLRRYLDGEPVLARPRELGYVLYKKARKHLAVVVLGGVLFFALIITLGMWMRADAAVTRREAFARELGQRVTEVELFLRYAAALPPHDMAPEKELIRKRIRFVEDALAAGDTTIEGPGHYALGRGHLALHEHGAAREHLELALKAEYDLPEVHYSLGLALGALYQEALDRTRRIEDRATRDAMKDEAESKFLLPALAHLRSSEGAEIESRHYVDGLVALYEKRYEDAVKGAVSAAEEAPWLHEARRLEGDAHFGAGMLANETGDKEKARGEIEKAAAAYAVAASMARSESTLHEALMEAWFQILVLDIWQGKPFKEAFDAALAACDDAVRSNPKSSNAWGKRAHTYFHVGYYEVRRGEDPRPTLLQGTSSAREALRLSPEDAVTWDILGNIQLMIGNHERKIGLDPTPSLDEAMKSYDQANRIQPAFAWAWNDGGWALLVRAESEVERGIDPRASVDSATLRFERAAELDPSSVAPHSNLIWLLTIRAGYDLSRGRDPTPDASRALASAGRALKLDPRWLPVHNNQGWAHLVLAQHQEMTGGDPSASLTVAGASFRTSLGISPDEADTHHGLGTIAHVRARFFLRTGQDPSSALDEGREALRKAVTLDASAPAIAVELARLEMTAAELAARERRDVRPALDAAAEALDRARKVNTRYLPALAALAQLHALRARDAGAVRSTDAREISAGLEAAGAALGLAPDTPAALMARGMLLVRRAETSGGQARVDEARGALAALEAAVKANPLLEREVSPHRRRAAALAGE